MTHNILDSIEMEREEAAEALEESQIFTLYPCESCGAIKEEVSSVQPHCLNCRINYDLN